MTSGAPVVAEVIRSEFVESVHHGTVAVVDAGGAPLLEVGPTRSYASLRSCLKPLQALGMVRAGLRLDPRDLAVVCSSHAGRDEHVACVRSILSGAGLTDAALQNMAGWPLDEEAARARAVAGGAADRVHQNCSGKHAGMLATCVTRGWPTTGYLDPLHPLQQEIRKTVEDLTGESVGGLAVDGCGAPLFLVTPLGLARAFVRLVAFVPESVDGAVAAAMRAHPGLVGGPGRLVTRLMSTAPACMAKDGAEGSFAAAAAGRGAVVVRIADGNSRPLGPLVAAALTRLDLGVADLGVQPVRGGGAVVGEVRAVLPS